MAMENLELASVRLKMDVENLELAIMRLKWLWKILSKHYRD